MGKASRDKGARGERSAAGVYVANGLDVFRLANAGGLSDLGGLEDLGVHPEVKSCARTDMLAWVRQTEAEAGANQMPVLHWRVCRRGLTIPWRVDVSLADWISVLKEARGL